MNRGKTPSNKDESPIPEEFLVFSVDEMVTKAQELYQIYMKPVVSNWDCTACREADN